ncbi:MAG: carbohydrate-binding domain-containing protein [Hespellia sp.]|nr:carbohydrate-binding domain-containing protein [Hespellia sp.]
MKKRKKYMVTAILLIFVLFLSGCSQADSAETKTAQNQEETTTDEDGSHASANTVTLTSGDYSDRDMDASYEEADATKITCDTDQVTIDGTGASADGQMITISKEGSYILSGTLSDGQVIVDATEKNVQLIFDNIQITSLTSAPVYVQNAKNTLITLADHSENYITDSDEYVGNNSDDEPSAAIFSKDDLTFNGTGSLEVVANYNNAIQSKDDLKFISGIYHIVSADDGIVGKDSVSVLDGTFAIESQSDGIKATNIKETDKGYVMIDGGDFTITAEHDGIQAETLLYINDGTFDITTGGGYENAVTTAGDGDMMPGNGMRGGRDKAPFEDSDNGAPEEPMGEPTEAPVEESTSQDTTSSSYKGLKSYVDVVIEDGTFTLNSADDAIHSNNDVTINKGTYTIYAGDDGIHADQALTIADGEIVIENSYEGIEGCTILIEGGSVELTASDDGMNSVNGNDETSSREGMDTDDGSTLTIRGGIVKVTASGDGLDANGSVSITGGTVEVQGPTNGGNGTFDYNGTLTVTGGTIYVCGSSQMAQEPSEDSTQGYIAETWNSTIPAGTLLTISDQAGNEIASFTTSVESNWFCISDSNLKSGETCILNAGGTQADVTVK